MEDYIYVEDDEEKKKKKKRRLIFWLIFLIIFIITSIISVVLVLAATQQRVDTDIDIRYRANNVSAEVSAKYWTENEKKYMYSGDSTVVTFDAAESEVDRSLSPRENIAVDGSHDVVFEYCFKNLSDYASFNVGIARSPRDFDSDFTYNIKERYYYSSTELTIDQFRELDGSAFSELREVQHVGMGAGTTLYIYVKVSILRLENDASYTGEFSWLLVNSGENF